jgi:chromosome segregation ATPase
MNRTLLLENLPDLLEDLDARLTALEAAKPQAQPVKISYVEHLAAEVKRLTALENNKPNERDWEAAANSALAQLTFSRKNVNWLRDTLDAAQDKIERLLAENRRLTDGFYALEAQRRALTAELSAMKQRRDALAAELGDRIKERKTIWAEVDDLKAQRNALAAQLDDLSNVNAGLRKDSERQSELIAALRQNSADLVESMKYLLSEAEPNKERMTALESLQDENATLRSRLAATSHQTDEIKRLEAVCDDLSDKLDAANCR